MIYVVAPGTGELVPRRQVVLMELPIRHGWDAWVHKDRQTGKLRKFSSYNHLRRHLRDLRSTQ